MLAWTREGDGKRMANIAKAQTDLLLNFAAKFDIQTAAPFVDPATRFITSLGKLS